MSSKGYARCPRATTTWRKGPERGAHAAPALSRNSTLERSVKRAGPRAPVSSCSDTPAMRCACARAAPPPPERAASVDKPVVRGRQVSDWDAWSP
eukprot:scaffold1628_cov407-Prasinococcus_capsulatus_cf.AAC.19